MRERVEYLIPYTFNHAASLWTIPENGPAAPTLGEKWKMVVNLSTRIVFDDSGGADLENNRAAAPFRRRRRPTLAVAGVNAMSMLQRNIAWGVRALVPVLLSAALAAGGCATTYPMMPTPVLYLGAQARTLFTQAPATSRTPPLDLLYITDRAPATSADDVGPYTANRSRSLAFGSTTVQFGDGVSWDTLVGQSTVAARTTELNLTVGQTQELGRFPPAPYAVAMVPAGLTRAPAVIDAYEAAKKAFQAELTRRLAISPRKEVVLFVHGYNNTFVDAALTMGELCHFLGREFVCAIFSWPAGGDKGVFFGYDVDRESGEFAAEDLKKTIRMIADTPGVEKVHLLAHSRGTDVLATAASELSVESYITQNTFGGRFKIANVVLLAPDIDIDVAPIKILKVLSDPDLPFGKAPSPRQVIPPDFTGLHITVYASPDDRALATSGWLFGSVARLGSVRTEMITPEKIAEARTLGLYDIIMVNAASCFVCHSYFVSNPRVSSDLIAMLRYGAKPNEAGRPLIEVARPFWRVPTDEDARAAKRGSNVEALRPTVSKLSSNGQELSARSPAR
jgi:esterase/lipase superfamily enzyme